ncbi:RDD family protein [Ferrimonas pelagia]|uniref:RDD family protein n=1 Tax=Ferrimonas pelagia TaxID=1177826 RepID=A0ABP9EGN3_9GAMM
MEPNYGGFWLRFLAGFIDTLLIMMVLIPAFSLFFGAEFQLLGRAGPILSYLLPAIAIIILWIQRSTTPGKAILRLKIVDATTGGKPTAKQMMVRYLGYYAATLPLFIGMLWMGWDPKKQGWHDKMAGTLVVRLPKPGSDN